MDQYQDDCNRQDQKVIVDREHKPWMLQHKKNFDPPSDDFPLMPRKLRSVFEKKLYILKISSASIDQISF